jgi:hypothetical protein
MARSFVHRREAGLERFVLVENHIDRPDLSDVTSVTVVVGPTTVYSTASDSGPVRWNTSETGRGEIIALVPTAAFTANSYSATITIYSPTYPGGLAWATKTIPVGDAAFFGQGGEQREQCEVCGRWFPVSKLIRQTHILRRQAKANYLKWSRYWVGNYWNLQNDVDYLGEVSMGRSTFYHKIHPYKNANAAGGCCSFWGSDELWINEGIDLSSFSQVLVRGRFGTHHTTRKPGLTIEFGAYHWTWPGPVIDRYVFGTRTGVDGNTAFVVNDLSGVPAGHRDAMNIFFKVTTYDDQQIWWGENFRVQKDEDSPGMTTAISKGAAISDSFLMKTYGKMVVCPDHRMHFEKQVNEYATTFDPVDVIDDEDEEF